VSGDVPPKPYTAPPGGGICGFQFYSAAHNPHGVYGPNQWHACELKAGHQGPHACGKVSEEVSDGAPELG